MTGSRSGSKAGKTMVLALAVLLAVSLPPAAVSCGGGGSGTGKTSLAGRKLLGLCSHDFEKDFKAKVPKSQWGYVRNARVNIQWWRAEGRKKGSYTWSYVDHQVRSALSLGLNSVMITIGGPVPGWAGRKRLAPPTKMQDWQDFCAAVAARYKGYVDFYQIWQEPGWDADAPTAAQKIIYFDARADRDYMGLLRSGYQGIKKSDPGAYVSTGSLLNSLSTSEKDFINYDALLKGAGQTFSMQVDSDKPITATTPSTWPNLTAKGSAAAPATQWVFGAGTTTARGGATMTLNNTGSQKATATVTFAFSDNTQQQKKVEVPANKSATVDINKSVSVGTVCDGLALHPYAYPKDWAWFYKHLVGMCKANGFPGLEVVVTEIGWPHESKRPGFSAEIQRKALGDQGVGSLYDAGCKKIWIYEDVDDPAPTWAGEDSKHGLFTEAGKALPAWDEYKNWQDQLPDYGNKPTSTKKSSK